MPKGLLIVSTNPASPEREDEYNQWYEDVHIVDVLKLQGFTAARRYRAVPAGPQPPAHAYSALYEVEADDLPGALGNLLEASRTGTVRSSDVIQLDPPPNLQLFELISES